MGIPQWLPVDLKEHMKANPSLQIIDVREPNEYASGHIPGAKLIPLGELAERYQEINKDADTVMVCRSGGRSGKACEILDKLGFQKIHNLMGGMLNWDGDVE